MRSLILAAAISAALSSPAWAVDCSTPATKYIKNFMIVSSLGMLFQDNLLSCLDLEKITIKGDPQLCATQVVDGYTIFTSCGYQISGVYTTVAVKGANYSEYQALPMVEYRYLGPVTFTKANGFSTQLPVIAPK